MKKQEIYNETIKIFWVFIFGSILGWIYETILVIIQTSHFEVRQGLVYGPFIPVYGIGGIMYYLTFKLIKTRNKIKVFFIAFLLGGITEYLCSYIQEIIFGTVSWEYSHLPFNLNGRTSLMHCTFWGIAGILYVMGIEPIIWDLGNMIQGLSMKIVTGILVGFIIFDIAISCMCGTRQKERILGIEAKNSIDVFLDKFYPDEFLDKIYSNKRNKLEVQESE